MTKLVSPAPLPVPPVAPSLCVPTCALPSFLLLPVQPLPKGDQVLNFSDAEDMLDDSKLK